LLSYRLTENLRQGGRIHSIKVGREVLLMEMMPVKPERKAQLEAYAERHGQDVVAALDQVLADYFDWEQQDYRDAVKGIQRGYDDLKAGRVQPLEEFFEDLRVEHGFPR
jgi:predicted transcriptional regulator